MDIIFVVLIVEEDVSPVSVQDLVDRCSHGIPQQGNNSTGEGKSQRLNFSHNAFTAVRIRKASYALVGHWGSLLCQHKIKRFRPDRRSNCL